MYWSIQFHLNVAALGDFIRKLHTFLVEALMQSNEWLLSFRPENGKKI